MRPKDNPFAAHRLDRVAYLFDNTDWERVLKDLHALDYRAAIIGVHGSGKTTFLSSLEAQLRQRGFGTLPLFVNTETRRLTVAHWQAIRAADANTMILFDGADVIPRWAWWRFKRLSRHAKGIVATSHGRRLLPPLIRTQPSAELLRRVLAELDVTLPPALQQYSEKQLKQHRGNIRDVLRDLYWVYADK